MANKIAIIAAGGTGSRMNDSLPKQYLVLHDKPILLHTIEAFEHIADKIIVVLHANMFEYWNELCQKYNCTIKHEIVFGGNTRFQSVKNAVSYLQHNYEYLLTEETAIAIHDAARPCVDKTLIEESYNLALQGQPNTLAFASTNSIRIGNTESSEMVNRDTVWQIQTPQTFLATTLIKAYEQEENKVFTDDASVVEKIGYSIKLLESNHKNIKITFPEDLEIAKIYLSKK